MHTTTRSARHLVLHPNENLGIDQSSDFLESLLAGILRSMHFEVERQLQSTATEVQLLARSLDGSKRVFVECKAQRETLPVDTISRLLGNATLRGAEAGWLFSTSELSKDDRARLKEIHADPEVSHRFMWYSPSKIIEHLISRGLVVDPDKVQNHFNGLVLGGLTLVGSPAGWAWLIEILDGGLPAFFSVFDAANGFPVSNERAMQVAQISERFASLRYLPWAQAGTLNKPAQVVRAPVAPVVSGDTWDDLRPARPIDFVGRDDVIQDIFNFIESVRLGRTTTRTFSIQGPSGWGKSSLVLKLRDLSSNRPGRRRRASATSSFTAVDSRSATNSGFVSGALQLALLDAAEVGLISPKNVFDIGSLTYPLDSADVVDAIAELRATRAIIVLVFDQFEELFAKESLFETFNAIRELSLDLDSKQLPVALGFAWKTDVSLPQQHPAYHLWHGLADRRRDFMVRQFGTGDIAKIISRAEHEINVKLSPALRVRLVEQCQGYPWLLKKLLVHVGKRLQTTTSQYALLERELDVEVLFKEDLAGLKAEQLQCLKYVAERAPAHVIEVENHFRTDVTNFLLSKRLLVRSGLNYVIYWDTFRDYLTEGRVPQIPWARTFQRDPRSAIRAAQFAHVEGKVSAARLAKHMNATERGCINVMSDLVALQIVDRVAEDQYKLAPHVRSTSPNDLAEIVHGQFARHAACRELAAYDRASRISMADLEKIIRQMKAGAKLSESVVHQYAGLLKRWLLFAGHLEERDGVMYRPASRGAQMGMLNPRSSPGRKFLGCGTPEAVVKLLRKLHRRKLGVSENSLLVEGLRNALYDVMALGLAERADDGMVRLASHATNMDVLIASTKEAVLQQPSVRLIDTALDENSEMGNVELGERLRVGLKTEWKPTSAVRYANGIRGFLGWAKG